jgi:hypothetical protein
MPYPGDVTDDEWPLIAPLISPAVDCAVDLTSEAGRSQAHGQSNMRCERGHVRLGHRMPVASDPKGPATAQCGARFSRFVDYDGTLDRMHHVLYLAYREQGKCEASPTVAIIYSRSVKSGEKGGLH